MLGLELEEVSLGLGDFGGVGEVGGGRADGEVGRSDAESVDGIGDIGGVLYDAVSVNVRVATAGDSVEGLDLVLGGWATGITVAVLSELVLAVVLAGDDSRGGYGDGSGHGDGGGYGDGSGHCDGGGHGDGRTYVLDGGVSDGSGVGDGCGVGDLCGVSDGAGNVNPLGESVPQL
jgi:hypothetical protein